MNTFANLETDEFYLIREKENSEVTLVQTLMETDHCIFILQRGDDERSFWKRKTEPLFQIIDKLTEEQADEYEELWDNEQTTFFEN